jgi:hypothetical protein
MILKYFIGGCHIMKTTMFKRVFAMLAVVVLLVCSFATTAFAMADTALSGTATDDTATTTVDESLVHAKLVEIYGAKAGISWNTVETDLCKYASSVQVDGVQVTVYLSQKPSTGEVGVQMGDDGKLVIDGISSDDQSSWNQLFSRFKGIIVALTGVGTLVMIVLFIIQFMKLGASAGNPQARSQALTGVLWTGVAAALLGSVTIIVGFFYNAI